MERKSDGDTYCNWCVGTVTKGLIKELEDLEIWVRVKSIRNYNINKIDQNTLKYPWDLRRLVVT